MAVTVPAGGGGVASKRLREQSGQLELAKGRTADERARAEAIAEASFSVYYKPTELYLELQQRLSWKGNGVPVFMRRNLLFRRVAPRPPRPTSPKVRVTVRSTIKAPVTLLIMLARKVSTGGSTVYDVAQTLAAPEGKAHDGGEGALGAVHGRSRHASLGQQRRRATDNRRAPRSAPAVMGAAKGC